MFPFPTDPKMVKALESAWRHQKALMTIQEAQDERKKTLERRRKMGEKLESLKAEYAALEREECEIGLEYDDACCLNREQFNKCRDSVQRAEQVSERISRMGKLVKSVKEASTTDSVQSQFFRDAAKLQFDQRSEMRTLIQSFQDFTISIQEKVKERMGQIPIFDSAISRLQTLDEEKASQFEEEVKKLEAEIALLSEETTEIAGKNERMREFRETTEKEIETLRELVKTADEEIGGLESQIEEQTTTNSILDAEIATSNHAIAQLDAELEMVAVESEKLEEKHLETMKAEEYKRKKTEKAIEAKKKELETWDEELAELEGEISVLDEQLSAVYSETAESRLTLARLTEELHQEDQKVAFEENRGKSLADQLTEIQQKTTESELGFHRCEEQRRKSKKELTELRGVTEERQKETERLKTDIDKLNQENSREDVRSAEIVMKGLLLRVEMTEERRVTELKKQEAGTETLTHSQTESKIERMRAEIMSVVTETEVVIGKKMELASKLTEKETENESELRALWAEVKALTEKKDWTVKEREDLEREIEATEQKQKTEIAELNKERVEVIGDLQEEIKTLRQQLHDKQMELVSLEVPDIADLEYDLESLEAEEAAIRQEIDDIKTGSEAHQNSGKKIKERQRAEETERRRREETEENEVEILSSSVSELGTPTPDRRSSSVLSSAGNKRQGSTPLNESIASEAESRHETGFEQKKQERPKPSSEGKKAAQTGKKTGVERKENARGSTGLEEEQEHLKTSLEGKRDGSKERKAVKSALKDKNEKVLPKTKESEKTPLKRTNERGKDGHVIKLVVDLEPEPMDAEFVFPSSRSQTPLRTYKPRGHTPIYNRSKSAGRHAPFSTKHSDFSFESSRRESSLESPMKKSRMEMMNLFFSSPTSSEDSISKFDRITPASLKPTTNERERSRDRSASVENRWIGEWASTPEDRILKPLVTPPAPTGGGANKFFITGTPRNRTIERGLNYSMTTAGRSAAWKLPSSQSHGRGQGSAAQQSKYGKLASGRQGQSGDSPANRKTPPAPKDKRVTFGRDKKAGNKEDGWLFDHPSDDNGSVSGSSTGFGIFKDPK